MRCSSDLAKLHEAINHRLIRLATLFTDTVGAPPPARPRLLAVCVIELDNLVVSGLRQYTISSLSGTRTVNGLKVARTIAASSEGAVAAYILSVINPVRFANLNAPATITRKEEPTVRDPREVNKVLTAAGAANTASLGNALALNSSVFGDLATTRNFYAHRNEDTFRKVRTKAQGMGVLGIAHTDDLVIARRTAGPARLFQEWLYDVELFFEFALE